MIFKLSSGQGLLPSPPRFWHIIATGVLGVAFWLAGDLVKANAGSASLIWTVVGSIVQFIGLSTFLDCSLMFSKRVVKRRVHETKWTKSLRVVFCVLCFGLTLPLLFLVSSYGDVYGWWLL